MFSFQSNCLSYVWAKFKNVDDISTLSYIESGLGYSRREDEDILRENDMLMGEISRKEKELEKAKSYIKKY